MINSNSSTFLRNSLFVLLLIAFAACNSDKDQSNTDAADDASAQMSSNEPLKLKVNQPFKNVNQSPKVLTHKDNEQAQTFTMETGTVIRVPAAAFEYMDGTPVQGAVELQFTEMHSASEIVVSGIPMKYIDEKGEEQWMQSAGMFEIKGFQNDKEVKIAEGKELEVELQSDVAGDYDFWSFDEEKGNWNNEGPVAAKEGPVQTVTPTAVQSKINQLKKQTKKKPVKPTINEANKLVFNDLNLDRCPDLKGQKPVVLLFADNDASKAPEKNKWIRKPGIWHKKTITPVAGSDGLYELTLFGDKMYQIKVKAAPSALEVDKAKAAYQKELAEYNQSIKLLKDTEALAEQRQSFIRMTRVRGFGRYNCDVLWNRRDAVNLRADFDVEDVADMVEDMAMIYLITDNDRTVINLPKRSWNSFRFSPSADNKILAVLPDNTAAVFTESEFEEQQDEMIESKGGEFVFSLDNTEQKIETLEDLDGILEEASMENVDVIQEVKVYPNPARDRVTVSYESSESIATPIMIFDANGRQVAIQNTTAQPGENKVEFNLGNLPNGNYVIRLTAGTFMSTKQLVVVRN